MSSYNELIALINGCINRNGVQAITGRVLNGVLRAMVNQLGAGYAMGGVAHPTDDPGTPDAPVCYYASEVGTYTHFGNIQIVPGELALLCFDLTDGWFKETMYEGFESVQATIDGNVGTPAVNVTYVNGVLSFDFSNMKGNTGAAAGFGNVTAAVDGTIGTPGVSVQTDGPDTAKNIAFQFTGLKGETGVTSVIATVDNTSGTPQCAVSLNGQQLTLAFTGLKGAQGDTGSSVAYPFTIVNNLTTDDATQALSAAQGVVLAGQVSQLEHKVDDISTGKFYGYHPTAADLPEGDVPGFAYVGTESPYSIYNFDGETWTDSGATVKRGEGQIIYLEDLDGYAADLSPTAMREFLQSAFDYVSGNKAMLVFPKGVTFTIDIPQVSETDPWYTLAYAAVSGGAGLWINGSCVIDFNFCTIKATPNSYRQYAVVYVPVTTNDVVIKNGNIVGERDEHTLSSVGASDEWDYALYIQSQRNVTVENMKMSNVRGDGIVIEGYIKFNNVGAPNFSAFTQGTIASGVVTADASSNTLISNKLLLSNYKHTDYNGRLLPSIYGYPTTNGYYTLPFPISVNASFYDESENFVSEENVQYGCQVTIPNGAIYVRISFTWVDATPFVGSTTQTLFLMDFSTNENILVRNSEVFDCGRNGITPVTGTPGAPITIDGCYIHDIYGTNNQVCVDVEGTSFLAGYVHIKNCRIENPGYTGVNLTSSWHNIVENCDIVGCSVVGRSLDNHITGCDIETADAGNGVRFNRVSSVDYSWELTFQKSSVKDTIVRNTGNLFVFNGVVDGCSYRNSYFSGASYVEGFPMLVSNCRIADTDKVKEVYITCGYYENCDFYSSKSINTRDVGPEIVIRNSKIATPTFASAGLLVSMYDCIIRRITGTSSYLVHTVGGIFIGNTFINDTGSNASAALAVYPSNVIIVRGNKFIAGTGQWYYSVIQIRTNTGYDNFTCIIEGNAISTTAQLNDGGFVNLANCGDKGIYFVSKNIALSHYVGKDIKLPNSPSNMKVYRGINIDVPASKLTVTTSPVIYEQDASWTPTATP